MSTMKCPLCAGTIKLLNIDKYPMIKCENNIYQEKKQTGCKFYLMLRPKALKGYKFKREEVLTMIEGGEVDIKGVKASYDINSEFSPHLVFPEVQDY